MYFKMPNMKGNENPSTTAPILDFVNMPYTKPPNRIIVQHKNAQTNKIGLGMSKNNSNTGNDDKRTKAKTSRM